MKKRLKIVNGRKSKGLTQKDFVEIINDNDKDIKISRSYLSVLENGKMDPSLKVAKRIAEVLNLRLDDIF